MSPSTISRPDRSHLAKGRKPRYVLEVSPGAVGPYLEATAPNLSAVPPHIPWARQFYAVHNQRAGWRLATDILVRSCLALGHAVPRTDAARITLHTLHPGKRNRPPVQLYP